MELQRSLDLTCIVYGPQSKVLICSPALDISGNVNEGVDRFCDESNQTLDAQQSVDTEYTPCLGLSGRGSWGCLAKGRVLLHRGNRQDHRHQPVWKPCHVNLCAYELWIFLTTQSEEMMIWWVESEEYTSEKVNSCKICTLLYRIRDHVRRGIQFGLPMIDIALRHGQQQLNLQSLEECDFKQLVAFHSYWVALHGAKIMLYCKRRLVFEFRWTPPALLPI